ncbi:RCC1 domain-containing protein [Sandaracinus amylolyticus]|uniref:BNR repeat domain protein n=1 Tax=Sandaracinus amylolyticus TaxID=927083 RepID=A0A0F6W3V0_9BACT|nr:hypothetical protein [Sandaracinus amylolyticus]AKF06640.1 BNR repeat domain protein [Sandaracinus amylolyticus]
MRRVALAMLALLAACSEPRSYLVVVIDAEPALRAEVDAIEVAIRGSTEQRPVERIDPAIDPLPLTIGLEAQGALTPVIVEARALGGATARVTRRVRTGFVRGEIRTVHVRLEHACLDEPCDAMRTCIAGTCVDDAIPPASLPPWTGTIDDAGTPQDVDASAPFDAAMPLDASSEDASTADARTEDDAGPPPLEPIPGPIAAGQDHTCAVKDARLWCWGGSDEGQAGAANGTAAVELDITRVAGVCAGMRFTCAWTLEGEAWCVGLMNGATGPVFRSASKRPLMLPAGTRARMMACGYDHACALLDDGRVTCAGRGTEGQLGDGLSLDAPPSAPVIASLDAAAVRIGAGEGQTCAHLEDRRVVCWGDNDLLRAGGPMSFAEIATPRDVDSMPVELASTGALAGGGGHTCAVAGGQLYCWGANTHGERGCLPTSPRAVATAVPGATTGASEVALGLDHTCVILGGAVHCSGDDFYGQTGRDPAGGTTDCTMVAVTQLAGETATHVAAGRFHACAILAGGDVACWGHNQRGQLGAGGADGWIVRRSRLP